MSLKKEGYMPRLVDRKIERYLRIFGAILVEGPKWCGKTWTALAHSNTVRYIMNPSAGVNFKETVWDTGTVLPSPHGKVKGEHIEERINH